MSETWTENNDGKTLPEEMDASQHSGYEDAFEKAMQNNRSSHDHKWKRGILPGNVCMKSCMVCGETVKPIEFDEWITLA